MGDSLRFIGRGTVRKFHDQEWTLEQIRSGEAVPYEIVQTGPNKIMYGGGSAMWESLIGSWSGDPWDEAHAAIGVGDSGAAEVQTQNNLLGGSRLRQGMDADYPEHTDSLTEPALHLKFKATYTSAMANFHWREWAVFNSATDGAGRMLQRRAEDLGLKQAGMTWEFLVELVLEC